MNSFEVWFFKKYLPKETEIQAIIHRHIVLILDRLFIFLFGFTLLPSFIYAQSLRIQELVPFYFLEVYLCIVFLKIFYDIFNWYNDAWIITKDTLYDVRWSIFKTKVESVTYENIEGIETEQNTIWDKLIGKWNIIVLKSGEDALRINDIKDPMTASNLLSEYTHKDDAPPEKDRFELILETLNGVVNEYLDKRGLKQVEKNDGGTLDEYMKVVEWDEATIDLREKKD